VIASAAGGPLILHQFPSVLGQDSLSSFCTKVQRCLNLRGLAFEVENHLSDREVKRLSPNTRKLPVLDCEAGSLQDSTHIARWADQHGEGPSLFPDDPLSQWIEDWADESLYWFLVYHRWKLRENTLRFAGELMPTAPGVARRVVAYAASRRLVRDLEGQGLGRLAPDRVLELLTGHLDRLDAQLSERTWFGGTDPSAADAAVFGILQGLHSPLLPSTRNAIQARGALADWAVRFDERSAGTTSVRWE